MGKEAGKGAGRELRSGGARCRDDLAVNNIQLIFEHKNYKCDPEKMEDTGNQSLKKDLTEGQVWPGTPCGNRKQVLRRDRVWKRGSRKSLRQCPRNLSNGQGRESSLQARCQLSILVSRISEISHSGSSSTVISGG